MLPLLHAACLKLLVFFPIYVAQPRNLQKGWKKVMTDWAVRGSNSDRGKRFYPTLKIARGSGGPSTLLCNGYRGLFPRELSGRIKIANNWLPPTTIVRNEWSYKFILPKSFHDVKKDNFVFVSFLKWNSSASATWAVNRLGIKDK